MDDLASILLKWVERFLTIISALSGGWISINNFIQLFGGDHGTSTWAVVGFGVSLLIVALIELGFRTEKSKIDPNARTPLYPRLCRPAQRGIIVILALAVGAVALLYFQACKETNKLIFAIADFQDNDKRDQYGVTNILLSKLQQTVGGYDDTLIRPLGETILEQQDGMRAREFGDRYRAQLIVWGWYTATSQNVWLTVHVENLTSPRKLRHSRDYNVSVAKLESFQFQQEFSETMTAFVLFLTGVARYEKGDYSEAAQRLNEALTLDHGLDRLIDKAYLYFYLGTSRLFLNEFKQAADDLSNAIKINPQFAQAYYNCALAHDLLGDSKQAIDNYCKAIEFDPKDYESYNNLGSLYAALAENEDDADLYPKAIDYYTKALEINPRHALTYYNRGLSYAARGFQQEAIVDYTKAIDLNPLDIDAYCDRGIAYASLQDSNRALADLNQAVRINPKFDRGYYNLGKLYDDLKDYPAAIDNLSKAIEINQDNYEAYNYRGAIYNFLGRFDEAIDDLIKATTIKPDFTQAYSNLSEAYNAKSMFDDAIATSDRAIAVDGEYVWPYYHRGVAYEMKDDRKKAIDNFQKVLDKTDDEEIIEKAKEHLKKLEVAHNK